MNGRRGSEGAGGCAYMQEVGKFWVSEAVDSLEGEKKYFVIFKMGS